MSTYQGDTDSALVHSVLHGDRERFNELVERYLPIVNALAFSRVSNREDALDVAQESFIKAFTSLHTLREPGRFGAWLRSITINISTSFCRSRKTRVTRETESAVSEPATLPRVEQEELSAIVRRKLDGLGETDREILLLYYFNGLDTVQIAALSGISSNAAKKRLQRAREALSAALVADLGDSLEDIRPTRKQALAIFAALKLTTPVWVGMSAATLATSAGYSASTIFFAKSAVAGVVAASIMLGAMMFWPSNSGVNQAVRAEDTASTPSEKPSSPEPKPDASATPEADSQAEEPILKVAELPPPKPRQMFRGTVYAPDGTPLGGATVIAVASFDAWCGEVEKSVGGAGVSTVADNLSPGMTQTTQTGPGGDFAMELPMGTHFVFARKGVFAAKAFGSSALRIKADAPPPHQDIYTEVCGTVRGQITDAATGKPIPGARLWFDTAQMAVADANGKFAIEGVDEGSHEIFAYTPSYARERILMDNTFRADAELDVSLTPGGVIRGRVVDLDGAVIPGATVGSPGSGTITALIARYTQADAVGQFVMEGARFDSPNRLEASADGFESHEIDGIMVTPDNPETKVTFRLKREDDKAKAAAQVEAKPASIATRAISGFVLDTNRVPLQGATVRWGARDWEGKRVEVETDEKGAFVLEGAPDLPGSLWISKSGHAPSFASVVAGPLDGLELTLLEGRSVEGRVVDSAGGPLAEVHVVPLVQPPGNLMNRESLGRVITDTEGRFVVEHLPAMDVTFDFVGTGLSASRDRRLDSNGEEHTIVMEATGAITGTVVDPDGKPVRNFRILLSGGGGHFAGFSAPGLSFTNDSGEFVVTELTTGRNINIIAVAEGYGDGVAENTPVVPVTQLPSADALVIPLTKARELTVHVVEAGDEKLPIANAVVKSVDVDSEHAANFQWGYNDRSWQRVSTTHSDSKGDARMKLGEPEGAILVLAPGFGRQSIGWTADMTELTATLSKECVIEGAPSEGSLPAGEKCHVRVNCHGAGSMTVDLPEQENGVFRIDQLPAGNFDVEVVRGSTTVYKSSFTLRPGESYKVKFSTKNAVEVK